MANPDALALRKAVEFVLENKQIENVDFQSRRVLVRADLNVPLKPDGSVGDASRIRGALPTIQLLQQKGAQIILISHLGRPSPKTQSIDEMKHKFSLKPVAAALKEILGDGFIGLADDCIGEPTVQHVNQLRDGQVLLLENTRFHAGDVANDEKFAAQLATLADVFINDAFGVSHRAQASVSGITAFVKDCYPGLLMRKEIECLTRTVWEPVRPFGVALGGAKVADKIKVLWSLIEFADVIVVGGRMAFTFLAAQGVAVGKTQIEEDWLEPALEMMATAKAKGVALVLPQDVMVGDSLEPGVQTMVVPLTQSCCTAEAPCVPPGMFGGDIGPASCKSFAEVLEPCRTVFWNGPMGKMETPEYANGTQKIAEAIAAASAKGAVTIVGGGDSVAAVQQLGLAQAYSHVSTGGGASLELIEGKRMPGIQSLAFPETSESEA